MTKSYLTSVSNARSKFPKKLLLWNYWDHEHIVGTHFKHYKKVNILYENDKCCYSERWSKIPYFPFYIKITDLLVLTDENQFEVFHSIFFNLIKGKQVFTFTELEKNNCKVTRQDFLQIPKIFKFLQPLFDKVMKIWFIKVWEEDMPMRERRLKVWKLGFQDFKGINYINNPKAKREDNSDRPYELKLPIPKITQIRKNSTEKTFVRLFTNSKHIGYGLPDL